VDKSKKTVITIHEGEYEFLRLAEIIKHTQYFDTLYEMLVTDGEVEYANYIIKYKRKNHKNKYVFISYDDNELPIRFYDRLEELAEDYNVSPSGASTWFKKDGDEINYNGDRIVRVKRKERKVT
jgi:hypothetical protein